MMVMAKKPDSMVYIVAILLLVIGGIVMASIISSVKNNSSTQTDIRARAGVVNTLKLVGIVSEIDTVNNTIAVSNVHFSPDSRSGPEVDYGTWIVVPPQTFSLFSATPGAGIEFVINASDFDVANKLVVASAVTLK